MSQPTVRQIVLASRPNGPPKPENFRLETGSHAGLAAGRAVAERAVSIARPLHARPHGRPEILCQAGRHRRGDDRRERVRGHRLRSPGLRRAAISSWRTPAGARTRRGVARRRANSTRSRRRSPPGLGVLGMPGFTAYSGLYVIGKPKAGETVVVAAASGPVGCAGRTAGQDGRRTCGRHCRRRRQVPLCHRRIALRCRHRSPRSATLPEKLAAACPKGIDVYFENVGGAVWQAVLPLLNTYARVPVCGLIAQYSATGNLPDPISFPPPCAPC